MLALRAEQQQQMHHHYLPQYKHARFLFEHARAARGATTKMHHHYLLHYKHARFFSSMRVLRTEQHKKRTITIYYNLE
jgi:hypothetical protein